MVKVIRTSALTIACLVTLCSCVSNNDIANLGGNANKNGITDTSKELEENSVMVNDVRAFIDQALYNHFSPAEYSRHLRDGRQPIDDVRNAYETEFSYITLNPRNGFSFRNCVAVPIPDVSEVTAVVFNEHNYTCEEAYSTIRYWLDKWNILDGVDLDSTVRDTNTPAADGLGYVMARDVWDRNDGSGFMFLDTNLGYVQIFGSGVGVLSRGVITDYLSEKNVNAQPSKSIDPYVAAECDVVASGSLEDMADKAYELIDGSVISIGEASKVLDGFYLFADGIGYEIYGVDVLKAADRYIYRYYTRRVYRKIPLTKTRYGLGTDYVAKYVMAGDQGSIYVAEPGDICAYYGFAGKPAVTPLCTSQTQIMGLKDAMDLVYNLMSDDYQCNINRIELCMGYYGCIDPSKSGLAFLTPCWEFNGYSNVSGKDIKIDVDVLTGEIGFKEYYVSSED